MGLEMATNELLKGLNAQQMEAVCQKWGPSLVIAGAGSGKTTVLTRRVAHLLSELRQVPWSILAVTFTNKAAKEMRERLESLVGSDTAKRLWIGTFHSICVRLLRREIDNYRGPDGAVWQSNFVIYDETDSLNLVKAALQRLNFDEKAFPPAKVRHRISAAKNDGHNHKSFGATAASYEESRIAEVFALYQADLARNNAFDFDDLILVCADLLKQRPDVLERQREQFKHILVDEFQDTNQSQYELIRSLAGASAKPGGPTLDWEGRSLMVVGDVDQSIYSWRRADYRIILGFQSDFKEAQLIKLEENYRSTQTILDVANSIISNNTERIEKVLRCNRGEGGKVQCFEAIDENDEAHYVVQKLSTIASRGQKLADCAVLYRTNAQSRALEEALVRRHMPYTMVGAVRFYERQEIKDILAYLKLVFNPADGQSFLRIVNTPRRGIGKTTIDKLEDYARQYNMSMLEAAGAPEPVLGSTAKGAKGLKDFAAMVRLWNSVVGNLPVSSLIEMILAQTGYVDRLKEDSIAKTDPTAENRIENLQEFLVVAKEFEALGDPNDLEGFLTRVSLVSDLDAVNLGHDAVKLMTLHSAKGLEFSTVFLTGLEEKLFPHFRSLDDPPALEEERRLMYVGVTRAADQLYLTYARRRMMFANSAGISATIPSRFLKEIRSDLMQGYYPSPETPSSQGYELPGYGGGDWGSGGGRRYEPSGYGSGGGRRSEPSGYGSGNRTAPSSPGGRPAAKSAPPARPRAMRMENPPPQQTRPPEPEPVKFEHLVVGDIVQHDKFGVGKVFQVIGEKDKELYNIEFESAGKRLLDPRFAKLVKLN